VNARNHLVHRGRFPSGAAVTKDAELFIRLTEFVLAKILDLYPSNVFNTLEELDRFMPEAS
jgi:hypothetical protein